MQARLSRFQGANAISSADFYDNGEGGGSGPTRAGSDFDITAGDLVNRLSMQVRTAAGHQVSLCDCLLTHIACMSRSHGPMQTLPHLTSQRQCHACDLSDFGHGLMHLC